MASIAKLLLRNGVDGLLVRGASGSVLLGHEFADMTITSRAVLQDPVDCVLAGQQREFKGARAHFGALRRIFRE